jgi:hypothetical protein
MQVASHSLHGPALELMPAIEWDKRRAKRWRDNAVIALNKNQVDEEVISWIFNIHISTVYRILDRVPESAQERCHAVIDMG